LRDPFCPSPRKKIPLAAARGRLGAAKDAEKAAGARSGDVSLEERREQARQVALARWASKAHRVIRASHDTRRHLTTAKQESPDFSGLSPF
jgi:hypothetical protein